MNIGGEQRKVKFGMNQTVLYCELRDVSVTEMQEELSNLLQDNGSILRDLVWSALKDGARIEKSEFEYSNLDVGDWLEDIEDGELGIFMKELTESMPKRKRDAIEKSKKKVNM